MHRISLADRSSDGQGLRYCVGQSGSKYMPWIHVIVLLCFGQTVINFHLFQLTLYSCEDICLLTFYCVLKTLACKCHRTCIFNVEIVLPLFLASFICFIWVVVFVLFVFLIYLCDLGFGVICLQFLALWYIHTLVTKNKHKKKTISFCERY